MGDIATQNIAHDERRHLYNKCQALEYTWCNQLTETIGDEYLWPLRNTHVDLTIHTILQIFQFLRNMFGKIVCFKRYTVTTISLAPERAT